MTSDRDSDAKAAGWAEHTVVANLPRLFPSAPALHAPLAEVEEPRTVVGDAPSRAVAQQLIARYQAASSAPAAAHDDVLEDLHVPLRESWFRRLVTFAQDDFQRAPRIVRLLLPALPLVAAATTFLDVDPAAPSLSRAVAVAATSAAALPSPSAATRPLAAPPALPAPLPSASVTIAKHPGRTLAAEAADAAARGDRPQAIALYAQLARENPTDVVYASAARILMAAEERERPHAR